LYFLHQDEPQSLEEAVQPELMDIKAMPQLTGVAKASQLKLSLLQMPLL
jgi:hypothetical protein